MQYGDELSKELLTKLASAVDDFEQRLLDYDHDADAATVTEKAKALFNLAQLIDRMRYAYSMLESDVANNMYPGEMLEIDGRVVEKKIGTKRKSWNHQALKSVVAETVLKSNIDPDTGEITAPAAVMIRQALDFPGVSYWKVTELKNAGIDPSHYCEEQPGNISLVFH